MRSDAEVDRLIADAYRRGREVAQGEFVPAIEYDPDRHGWIVGAKDHRGCWAEHAFICGSLRGGMTLREIGRGLRRLGWLMADEVSASGPAIQRSPG